MTTTISRKAISSFSSFSNAFGQDQTPFSAFIQQPFGSISDLTDQAKRKLPTFSSASRKVLIDTIARQLENTLSESQAKNLDLLRQDTTVTITTGHQLTLFGGPLFLLYKVLHVVKLSKQFNESQTEFKAVPVFWLASEDHDFEEIQSAQLFNRNLTWETEQKGPVGRFSMDNYQLVSDELKAFFTTKEACELLELVKNLPETNYAVYYQQLMNRLFADFGVLVVQPDDLDLKQLFIPVLQREISEQPSLNAVQETNAALQKSGWQPQAQARACNLFLLDATGRHRIDPSTTGFSIDGNVYTKEALLQMAEQQPESFSPNVILRPVYQETILPNLAYIGGGGEIAYWIQLKGVFEAHNTVYPLIQQRNSLLLVDGGTAKRIEKTGWELTRFFEPKEQLRKAYLLEHDADQLNMEAIQQQFQTLRLSMISKAKEIDVSLESFAEAETVRMSKQLEVYEQRLLKQVKQQHEQALKAIDGVCDRFLPGNELQERALHWLNFAPSGDYSGLLATIETAIAPFESDLIVVELKN
ncbi:MAG TPA: bacillithiol biosynthesis cysteine-adding enzyme BshC [Fluviicola sp.]|nr:bacillithiol biosynthesis cysteine-adding enzyme BshC [Fluviicola sp.]